MNESKVLVTDAGLRIVDIEVPRKDVADFFSKVSEAERVPAVIQAIEVGVFCLERAGASVDTDFVRRQIDSLLAKLDKQLGELPKSTRDAIVAKIGSGEGQVLEPIKVLVHSVAVTAKERVDDVRQLLREEIDPRQEESTIGKALRQLRDLLDPKHQDSIQNTLTLAVDAVAAKDGSLATVVRTELAASLEPLQKEVKELAKEVHGKEAAAEALQQTTEKGAAYESEVVDALQSWKEITGAEVTHVGGDNQPGDILVSFGSSSLPPAPLRIVIEVKDQQSLMGRKRVCDAIDSAMATREADAAIFLSRTQAGLAQDLGEWTDGVRERGPYVACVHSHLVSALRFLIMQRQIASARAGAPEVNVGAVQAHLERARAALAHVKNINTNAGKARSHVESIEAEARAIRDEVGDALAAAELALRSPAAEG